MITSYQDDGREHQAPKPVVLLQVSQFVCYSKVNDISRWWEEFHERASLIGVPSNGFTSQRSLAIHHILRTAQQDGSAHRLK